MVNSIKQGIFYNFPIRKVIYRFYQEEEESRTFFFKPKKAIFWSKKLFIKISKYYDYHVFCKTR